MRFISRIYIYIHEDESDRNHVDVEAVSVYKVDGHQFPGRGMKSFEVVYHVKD